MTSQQKTNKEILLLLLKATSMEEVNSLIENHPFFKSCGWSPYGGNEFNAGIINAQSPDPVGALVEKITNGIDAILTKKCIEEGIDPTSETAPQSQQEAIKKYFGDKVLNFDISGKEVRELASKTVRIFGEGSAEKPTISILDFGEGQHPSDFSNTFLSIAKGNKIKIKFAHGVYNSGGSAVLKFCGSGYQLILSRRLPDKLGEREDSWGFTLVRERWETGYKSEWYEYCVVDNEIPSFDYSPLQILPDGGVLEGGTLIRLYSYELRNPNFFITGQRERELAREINKRFFSMPLPIEINELRTQLKGWSEKNKATRIYGLWRLAKKQIDDEVVKKFIKLKAELGVFGMRDIQILIMNDEGKDGKSYKNLLEKIFLTVNGQAQHTESVSFLKTKCLLPDLAPYMLVHIDLSNAGHQANKIFRTDRSGVIEREELWTFQQRLTESIKGDETLKELNREYRDRKILNSQPEDKDLNKYIGKLVHDNPFLAKLLNIGVDIPTEKPDGPKESYEGQYIPTYFEVDGESEKAIPVNRYGKIRMKTDASNDYLSRETDRGELQWSTSKYVQVSQFSLRNGFLPIRIQPTEGAKPGDQDIIIFELTRPGQESLMVEMKFTISEYAEPKINPQGPPTPPTRLALNIPKLVPVSESEWSGRYWNEMDITEVVEDQDGIRVYVNQDAKVLKEFPKRNPQFSSGDMMKTIKKHYLASVYLYAVAMYFDLKETPDKRDWAIPMALKSISKFILDLAFTARKRELEED